MTKTKKWEVSKVQEKEPKRYYTKKMKLKDLKTQWFSLLGFAIFCSLVIYVPTVINDDIVGTNLASAMVSQKEYVNSLESHTVPHKSFENTMEREVMALIEEAGLNTYEAYAIIQCESRWDPDVISKLNTNGTQDLGLWQINSIHKDISNIDKLDYIKATKWTIAKRLSDGNFCAWVCAKKLGICN